MSPPRLVATDLDGTLLRWDNTVSDRTRAALARVGAAGSQLLVVTGRPVRWLAGLGEEIGHQGLALVSNGAGLFDLASEQLRWTMPIAPEQAGEMSRLIGKRVPEATFAGERSDGYVREASYATPFPDMPGTAVLPLDEVTSEPLLKLLVRAPSYDADGLLAAAREVVGDHLGTLTHSSREGLIEISAVGVSKASGLERVASEAGLGPADVVAFGDMPNDIPMLTWAGRSWAVADAHPEAKAAADELTVSNEDDGVAVVLERLFA